MPVQSRVAVLRDAFTQPIPWTFTSRCGVGSTSLDLERSGQTPEGRTRGGRASLGTQGLRSLGLNLQDSNGWWLRNRAPWVLRAEGADLVLPLGLQSRVVTKG